MNNENNFDDLENRIEEMVEELVEDLVPEYAEDAVEDAAEDIVSDMVHDILSESLANCELVTKDGSVIRSKPMMCLMNPDQSMTVHCFGGLRVRKSSAFEFFNTTKRKRMLFDLLDSVRNHEDTNNDWCLEVQTWVSKWEPVARFETREETVAALKRVNEAMLSGKEFYQM